jgi:peptide/nickel transport system permease protein
MSELILSQSRAEHITNQQPPIRSLTQLTLQRFLRHHLAVVAIGVLALVILSAVAAPLLPDSPTAQNPRNAFAAPSPSHWFGTDDLGRDVLTRTFYGGRISLAVGLLATLLSLSLGVAIGAIAGYFGGWIDNVLMRLVDVFLTLPTLFVLILISTILRDLPALNLRNSAVIVILVIAIFQWMWPARLVRGEFLSIKERDFITAARATGVRDARIIWRHILPNTVNVIIVQGTLLVAFSIITESGLSYLGFGIQPPTPSWGNLLSTAQTYALRAPWLMIFPGLMIFLTSMAVNYIGDGLRDAFDPFTHH